MKNFVQKVATKLWDDHKFACQTWIIKKRFNQILVGIELRSTVRSSWNIVRFDDWLAVACSKSNSVYFPSNGRWRGGFVILQVLYTREGDWERAERLKISCSELRKVEKSSTHIYSLCGITLESWLASSSSFSRSSRVSSCSTLYSHRDGCAQVTWAFLTVCFFVLLSLPVNLHYSLTLYIHTVN